MDNLVLVTVRLPESLVNDIQVAASKMRYSNKSDVIRAGVRLLLTAQSTTSLEKIVEDFKRKDPKGFYNLEVF